MRSHLTRRKVISTASSRSYVLYRRDYDAAEYHNRLAVELNPNDADRKMALARRRAAFSPRMSSTRR
jgi:hypothetical protein